MSIRLAIGDKTSCLSFSSFFTLDVSTYKLPTGQLTGISPACSMFWYVTCSVQQFVRSICLSGKWISMRCE